MTIFESFVINVNDFIWTYIMIALLLGVALWFTIRTRFVQFRQIGGMVRLLGEGAVKGAGKEHVSSFQAFCISLSS